MYRLNSASSSSFSSSRLNQTTLDVKNSFEHTFDKFYEELEQLLTPYITFKELQIQIKELECRHYTLLENQYLNFLERSASAVRLYEINQTKRKLQKLTDSIEEYFQKVSILSKQHSKKKNYLKVYKNGLYPCLRKVISKNDKIGNSSGPFKSTVLNVIKRISKTGLCKLRRKCSEKMSDVFIDEDESSDEKEMLLLMIKQVDDLFLTDLNTEKRIERMKDLKKDHYHKLTLFFQQYLKLLSVEISSSKWPQQMVETIQQSIYNFRRYGQDEMNKVQEKASRLRKSDRELYDSYKNDIELCIFNILTLLRELSQKAETLSSNATGRKTFLKELDDLRTKIDVKGLCHLSTSTEEESQNMFDVGMIRRQLEYLVGKGEYSALLTLSGQHIDYIRSNCIRPLKRYVKKKDLSNTLNILNRIHLCGEEAFEFEKYLSQRKGEHPRNSSQKLICEYWQKLVTYLKFMVKVEKETRKYRTLYSVSTSKEKSRISHQVYEIVRLNLLELKVGLDITSSKDPVLTITDVDSDLNSMLKEYFKDFVSMLRNSSDYTAKRKELVDIISKQYDSISKFYYEFLIHLKDYIEKGGSLSEVKSVSAKIKDRVEDYLEEVRRVQLKSRHMSDLRLTYVDKIGLCFGEIISLMNKISRFSPSDLDNRFKLAQLLQRNAQKVKTASSCGEW